MTVPLVEQASSAGMGADAAEGALESGVSPRRGHQPPTGLPGDDQLELFGDRLAARVQSRRSQLVLGLDPDPARLWPEALGRVDSRGEDPASPAVKAARAVAAHCELALDAVGEECVAVKLQVACFERLGAPGWSALADTVGLARERGLLVIADAKRGDVDVTAVAYAQAFLGETPTPYGAVPGLGADALTVNPLLGRDALAPFVETARAGGRGLFVLVRTSNPGAGDVQELPLAAGERVSRDGGCEDPVVEEGVGEERVRQKRVGEERLGEKWGGEERVSERLATIVEEAGAGGIGRIGLSDVGAVVGATAPERLQALRERMPHAVFLLPGIGAQGGKVQELAPAFARGPAGGLVSASRGIIAAHERAGGDPAGAARSEAQRLRELAWRLAE